MQIHNRSMKSAVPRTGNLSTNSYVTPWQWIHVQNDPEVTRPTAGTFYLPKKTSHWNHKTKKQRYIDCWKCPPRSATHAFAIFLVFYATRWRRRLANGSPDETTSTFLANENREIYPNSSWQFNKERGGRCFSTVKRFRREASKNLPSPRHPLKFITVLTRAGISPCGPS